MVILYRIVLSKTILRVSWVEHECIFAQEMLNWVKNVIHSALVSGVYYNEDDGDGYPYIRLEVHKLLVIDQDLSQL